MTDPYFDILFDAEMDCAIDQTKKRLIEDRANPAVFKSSDREDSLLEKGGKLSFESYEQLINALVCMSANPLQDDSVFTKQYEKNYRAEDPALWEVYKSVRRCHSVSPTSDYMACFLDGAREEHSRFDNYDTRHRCGYFYGYSYIDDYFRNAGHFTFEPETRYGKDKTIFSVNQPRLPFRPEVPRHDFSLHWFCNENPIYATMSVKEKQWYYYWIHETEEGRFPPVYAGYIFLYIRDLIWNLDVKENLEKLFIIWQRYQGPLFDYSDMLINWVFAGAEYAKIPVVKLNKFSALVYPSIDPEIVSLMMSAMNPKTSFFMPASQFKYLIPKRGRVSNYYQENGKKVDEAFVMAVSYADEWHYHKEGKRLLEKFRPADKISTAAETSFPLLKESGRDLNSNHYYYSYRYYPYVVRPSRGGSMFINFLTGLKKETEIILRKIDKVKGVLNNKSWYSENREFAENLQDFLDQIYNPDFKPEPDRNWKPVSLDQKQIRQLREESDQVREILKVEDELTDLSSNIPLTSGDPWQYSGSFPDFSKLPDSINDSNSSNPASSDHFDAEYASADFPADTIAADTIAADTAANALKRNAGSIPSNASSVQSFFYTMPSHLQQALALILENTGSSQQSELNNLASQEFSMPDILMDAINAHFMESFGDILLEENNNIWQVLFEYLPEAQSWLKSRQEENASA